MSYEAAQEQNRENSLAQKCEHKIHTIHMYVHMYVCMHICMKVAEPTFRVNK
jgi:hypothetical protein